MVADHLSRLNKTLLEDGKEFSIGESFPDEHLYGLQVTNEPWFADFANFLACNMLPPNLSYQ